MPSSPPGIYLCLRFPLQFYGSIDIQRAWRCAHHRKRFAHARRTAVRIQAWYRRCYAYRRYVRMPGAALLAQRIVRGHLGRCAAKRRLWCATYLTCSWLRTLAIREATWRRNAVWAARLIQRAQRSKSAYDSVFGVMGMKRKCVRSRATLLAWRPPPTAERCCSCTALPLATLPPPPHRDTLFLRAQIRRGAWRAAGRARLVGASASGEDARLRDADRTHRTRDATS